MAISRQQVVFEAPDAWKKWVLYCLKTGRFRHEAPAPEEQASEKPKFGGKA